NVALSAFNRPNHCVEKSITFDKKQERAPALAEFRNADGGACLRTWQLAAVYGPARFFAGRAHSSHLAFPNFSRNVGGVGVQQVRRAVNAMVRRCNLNKAPLERIAHSGVIRSGIPI